MLVGVAVSVLLLGSAVVAAFACVFPLLHPRLSFLECVFMSAPLGLSASAWVALLAKSLPLMQPGIGPDTLFLTLAAQLGVCWVTVPRAAAALRSRSRMVAGDVGHHRTALVVLGLMAVWWCYMNYIHYLFRNGSAHIAGGSVYSDLPFHLNLSTSFVYGCNMHATVFTRLLSPFFAGQTLAYPFLPDFFVGVLMSTGLSIQWSLVLPGSVLLSAMFALQYSLTFRVSRSRTAALLSVFLTLLAGGLGGFRYAAKEHDWWKPSVLTSAKFTHGPDHVLYWVDRGHAFWFSLPAHILFPQRTVQHAYPLAIAALLVVWAVVEGKAKGPKAKDDDHDHDHDHDHDDHRGSDRDDHDHDHDNDNDEKCDDEHGRSGGADVEEGAVRAKGGRRGGGTAGHAPSPFALSNTHFTQAWQCKLLAFAGLITGLIPLMQPHSFISIGVVILVTAVLQVLTIGVHVARRRAPVSALREAVVQWSVYGVVSFALGLPQFFLHFFHRVTIGYGTGRASGFIRVVTAWAEMGQREGPVHMWWKALGLFVPLYVLAVFVLRTRERLWWYCGFVALFVVCNNIMFQPWHLDNTKLLYVWVFGASGFVCMLLARVLRWGCHASSPVAPHGHSPLATPRRRSFPVRAATTALVAAVYACLVFSGALACWREMLNNAKVYDDIEFDLAQWLIDNTPSDAVILTDVNQQSHIRAESSLAGRQIACGFSGWLSSHGINFHGRRADMARAMRGQRGALQSLAALNVTYFVLDQGSEDKWNQEFVNIVSDPVATNGKYTVFKVKDAVFRNPQPPACANGGAQQGERSCWKAGCWFVDGDCVEFLEPHTPQDCDLGRAAGAGACREAGCLWFHGFPGPWCQKSPWQVAGKPPPETIKAHTPPVPGSDCGWASMSEQLCAKRGCKWAPAPPFEPWCTFP